MNEITDPVFERPDINFSSPFDFRTRYSNRKVPNIKTGQGQPKEVSLADAWLDDIDRRQYDGIVFDPEFKSPDTYYNLFRGFLLEPKSGDWSLYMDHMIEVICGGNESHGMWLMTWMARILQEPGGKRPGTCVVLRGEQGTGKGCFVSLFGRIFGTHFLQITNQKHLTSNFNQHLKDAILVFVDEGFWAGDKTAEGVLKGLITEDHHLIEQKGKDVIAVKNHINLVMASNSEWVIPAAMEERRFAVFDVSNKHRRDKKYFNSVFNQMLNKGGCEAMLHDLLNLDLKTYREQYDIGEIPRTAALMDQIVHSMNSAQKFWFERLRDGTLLPSNDNWIGEIQTVVLHHSYMAFANDIGVARNKGAEYQFLKELRRVCPDMERIRMPNVEGSRPWGYRFPSLEECRQAFCDKLSININFNENIEVDDGINEEEV